MCVLLRMPNSFQWLTQRCITVLKPGLISQANGSAYIETQKTKIACAVCVVAILLYRAVANLVFRYGPRQSRTTTYSEKGKLNVEVKFAPFSCKKRRAPIRVSWVPFLRDGIREAKFYPVGRRGPIRGRANSTSSARSRAVGVIPKIHHRRVHHHYRERRD